MADATQPSTAAAWAPAGDLQALRTFLPFFWPKNARTTRLRLVAAIVLMAVTAGLGALSPLIFAKAVDALSGQQAAFLPAALLIGYGVVFATGRALMELRWIIVGPFDQSVRGNITHAGFERVHQLGLRFHLSRKTGKLVDVINRGIGAAWQFIFGILMTLVPVVLDLAVVAFVMQTFFDAIYALLIVVTAIVYVSSLVIGAERHRPYQRKAVDEWGEIWGHAVDGLLNYETVKYFNAEDATVRRLDSAIRTYERTCAVALNVRIVTTLIPIAILGAGFTAMIWLAGRQALAGEITVGGLILVNTYLLQVLLPLENAGQTYRDTKQALVNLEQFVTLLHEPAEVVDAPSARLLPHGPGSIRFAGVSFAYDPRRPILHDVSFEVPAGTTTAIVGPSGSGKTTVGRLLFRFYEPSSGAMEIDGHDLRAVTIDSARAEIGVVPQDTVPFNDTLYYNIAFAREGATRQEVEYAAQLAHIHDFIARLPEGYDTVVGERGLKLSGGEKQRVAIARVLLKRPRILLFDEATSALDTRTERAIQENLREVSRGVTTVVIAHRLSTVVHAYQILVMEDGRVVERGSHDELLAMGGPYAALGPSSGTNRRRRSPRRTYRPKAPRRRPAASPSSSPARTRACAPRDD